MKKKVPIFLFVVSFLFLLLIPQTTQTEQPFYLCDLAAVDVMSWAATSESFDGTAIAINPKTHGNESFLANHYAISESIQNDDFSSTISQETAIKPLNGEWIRGEASKTLKIPFVNGSFNNVNLINT